MKWTLFKRRVANYLVNLAYKIDPLADSYKQYILDKAISHAVMGGMIKIDWISPKDLRREK